MAKHIEIGKQGEELARIYLQKKGFKILHTNWRFGKDEIDIIAKDGDYLVIVEVKTLSSNYFTEPEFAVNKRKQGFLIRAANSYIFKYDYHGETRFDIVSVTLTPKGEHIYHIEDAFYPLA